MIAHDGLVTSELEGRWIRTDVPGGGIVRVDLERADDGLKVGFVALVGDEHVEWGTIPVDAVYAASPAVKTAVAFVATFEGSDMKAELHGNVSKGLLIIASMTSLAGSRPGEFAREFFRKAESSAAR